MTRKTRNQAAVDELLVTATLAALGHALVDVETRAAERDRAAS